MNMIANTSGMTRTAPVINTVTVMGIRQTYRKYFNAVSFCVVHLFLFMGSETIHTFGNLSSAASSNCMKFMTWNATGIMSSASYLSKALKSFDVDVCGISEHWLYKKDLHFLESIHKSYNYSAVSDFDLERPSRRKVGKGGVALLWKCSIDSRISVLNIDDDRMIGLQYQISENTFIYVI